MEIYVKDPCDPTKTYIGEVVESQELAENCTAYLVDLTNAEYVNTPIPVIVYADGYQFTPWDWQAGYQEIPEDITAIRWISQGGAEAVMVGGLPHVFTDWCAPSAPTQQEYHITGYDSIDRVVRSGSNTSARVNVPAAWHGCEVKIIRLN